MKLTMKFNQLPPSVNNYLKPSVRKVGNKHVAYMYETTEAKSFKKAFGDYLKREVKKQGWDISETKNGHWYLDCYYIQSRTNQDNNNYYKILCDSMSGIAIDDDKNILIRTQKVLYDSKNPRFIAVLSKAKYMGIFDSEDSCDSFIENNCANCSRYGRNCSILKDAKIGKVQESITTNDDLEMVCSSKKQKKTK